MFTSRAQTRSVAAGLNDTCRRGYKHSLHRLDFFILLHSHTDYLLTISGTVDSYVKKTFRLFVFSVLGMTGIILFDPVHKQQKNAWSQTSHSLQKGKIGKKDGFRQ